MIGPVNSVNYALPYAGINTPIQQIQPVDRVSNITPLSDKTTQDIEKTSPSECQTCNNRRYVDGSNENNVSFKAPGHISPQASFSAVSAHEQEHVSNAYKEGSKEGNRLISASVSLQMAVCPECGTTYIAGGTTRTTIEYNVKSPYENARKAMEGSLLKGMNIDLIA